MNKIGTVFYSEGTGYGIVFPYLLVTDVGSLDIDKWVEDIKLVNPSAVIPPYDPLDSQRTSRCADMAKTRLKNVGVVVAGRSDREREEFFLWAQENGYSPIVLLPHRNFSRQRQIMQLAVPKYIKPNTWIHLPEPVGDFDPQPWPGVYTTGEEFRRMV